MKNLKLRKILFGSVIAAMSLATVSLSIFAIKASNSEPVEVSAASSLTNNGYEDGEYQYYTGSYYDSIGNGKVFADFTQTVNKTNLISALRSLIQPSSAFGYNAIWTFNETYDCYPSDYDGTDPLTGNTYPTTDNSSKKGKMWDMYSDKTWTSTSQRAGNVQSYIGGTYNREHSMPKSWFGGSDSNQPGTDPNHLFNTDGKVNGIRSNYAYGEVTSVTTNCYTFTSGCVGFGKLGTNSSGMTVFEPDDAYKGDLARAQMYMATAYYNWNLTQQSGAANYCFTYSNNVSTMKDYYINLLTKWSAQDPVSQKEINRNNSVYSQQGNRNPFIDHPGWANKIWGGTEYTWGKSSGTDPVVNSVTVSPASLSLNLVSQTTGQLTATVNVSNAAPTTVNWSSSNTSVATVSSSGLVTAKGTGSATITATSTYDSTKKATCSVTVTSAPVSYTVTFNANGHGTAPSSQTITSGGLVTEPTAPTASGYTFGGWYKEAACSNAWNFNTDTVTANTILYAKWTSSSSSGNYEKVTSSSDITDGTYLIVYEDGSKAFDGSLTSLDVANNTIAVSISSNTIQSNATVDASSFTFTKSSSNFTIQAASGKYIGQSSNSNGIYVSDSEQNNTVSISSGNVNIVGSGGAYLRFNAASDQARFRYYKTSSYSAQQAIQLYKKAESASSSYTADEWAQLFLDNVSCNVSGTSEPTLNMSWSELSDAYDNVVSTTEKNLLKNASFTVTGSGSSTVVTPDSGTTQVVANAISKYEIIVRKYSYTNFIGRSGLSGQVFFLTDSESTSMVVAIVITSLIAISTIGGFIFLKKKKENY